MKGDLHAHSYYSDGLYSPAFVVEKAKACGCDFIALTDHDTLEGVLEADEAAARLGIRNIHGVELSAYENGEVHILGYGVDLKNAAFLHLLSEQQARRKARAEKLIKNLAAHGIALPDDCFEGKVKSVISRSHIARAIAECGYEPDFFVAMRKWLKEGAPTYVPNEGIAPEAAIDAVHAAGGYAVLAHPVRLAVQGAARDAFIERLAAHGLDGIEAMYKYSDEKTVCALKKTAARLGLFVTAGADYHGEGQEMLPRKVRVPFLGKK